MFCLNDAIEEWCRRAHPRGRLGAERRAELGDHLHCAVEELMSERLKPEEAFRVATEQLGAPERLHGEFAKNRSLAGRTLCRLQGFEDRGMAWLRARVSPKQASRLLIWVSLLAAGLMLLSAALLGGSGHSQTVTYWILTIWFVPFFALSQRSEEGCRMKNRNEA